MKKSCKDKSPVIGKSRLFTALMPALICVSMWGCGLFDEEVNHVVDSERYNGIVFAIIDDSLALETNGRRWTDHTDHCDNLYDCETGTPRNLYLYSSVCDGWASLH